MRRLRPGLGRIARGFVLFLALIGVSEARGPLFLPDSPQPNLATIDIEALRKKAAANDAPAMADLGLAYAHGWKARRDPAEAVRWLNRAVAARNRLGRRELGLLLLRGEGVARDPERGVELLRLAAEAGDMTAAAALGAAHGNGEGTPRNWPEAL